MRMLKDSEQDQCKTHSVNTAAEHALCSQAVSGIWFCEIPQRKEEFGEPNTQTDKTDFIQTFV